jgi:protein-glutamine gamma-glutamyltransferase
VSTTLAPPPPSAPAAAAPSPAAARPARAPRAPGLLRALGFTLLLVQGALAWARQLAPQADRVALQGVAVALALAAALVAAGRLPAPRPRRVVTAAAIALAVVAALPAAGIPVALLGWHQWDVLGAGVGEALGALPDLNVPYRGLDEWVRWVLMAGAGLLGVLAAALAFTRGAARGRGARSLGAAVALGVLYGTAIVERNPDSPYRSGLLWAASLALFLGADRLGGLRGPRARATAAAVTAATLLLASLVAPHLDGPRPILDYRAFGQDLAKGRQDVFDWNHSYTPLRWPRDGRELLRVEAKVPAYWKATTLPRFDGLRWEEARSPDPRTVDTPFAKRPTWFQDIHVTVRSLRSEQYLTAGWTTRIFDQSLDAQPVGSGSYATTGRPLKAGDTYSAAVYVPKPSEPEMRAAGTIYPDYTRSALTMELPPSAGGPDLGPGRTATIAFAPFGSPDPSPTTFLAGRGAYSGGTDLLARSGYRRTWRLAQQLRAAATSPLALVRSVRRRVQQGATYTETPAQGRVPLDAFLWDTKQGYCQQFSGAMALLLRMAGVPARVASGFAPGKFEADRSSYVVRDLDAHSWVEAFFPGIGWVTFDPTPTIAPANSQDTGDGGDTLGGGSAATAARADTAKAPGGSGGASGAGAATAGGTSPLLWAAVAVALAAAVAAAVALAREARTPAGTVEELRRALVRSGRPAAPDLTLDALERSLSGSTVAQSYVRKLRQARYAGRPAVPTRDERAALRRELAAGLGATGRLRSWWALPPRPGRTGG